MKLIQLHHADHGRRVAVVEEPQLILIDSQYPAAYDIFANLVSRELTPPDFISTVLTDQKLDYDAIYQAETGWDILPAFDHPVDPMRCTLSGTGLTHKASADNRQKMHEKQSQEDLTDSMEIYLWGEEGGKPADGKIGVQPEWFYKGNGRSLRGHRNPLEIPPYADDGGDEPEIAGIYYIAEDGTPIRVGFAMANEFSDHIMEKKNYLYLAPSKLRTPAVGPELVLQHDFQDIKGRVSVTRNDREIWSKQICTGEQNMSHSLANLEHHHFKYAQHRIPGTVHIHFFGADAFSFGENIQLKDGDWMNVSFEGFGRPLRNPVHINPVKERLRRVHSLY